VKLVTFERHGTVSYGVADGGGIVDVGAQLGRRYSDLRAVLTADALAEVQTTAKKSGATLRRADVRLLPVIPNPAKIFCVGLNYRSHVAEMSRPESAYPAIFTRFADSQVGDGAPLLRPSLSTRFDYEGELAIVIGRGGRYIKEADALSHIAGYACYNDGSVRDWQRHTHQWVPGKNFPGTGAFGPWLVTADEIPDPTVMTLTTRLNGQVVQNAPLSNLIYTIPVIIAYLSAFTPLAPGDVIATGTPGGVGDRRDPPLYMKAGDVVEVEVDRVGVLRNTVQDEV
jgi:2-keto-4-pentenoate hydratase/2-oxohepta-3-ene-1,7-dioic acid hydratase in catechol pathway